MRAVVQVVSRVNGERKRFGSAFFISPRVALTAAHVVRGLRRVWLYTPTRNGTYGRIGVARVELCPAYTDGQRLEDDWAILTLASEEHTDALAPSDRVSPHDAWRTEAFAAVTGEPLPPSVGESVALTGSVSAVGESLQLYCNQAVDGRFVVAGASGGPIIVHGKVVGILSGGYRGEPGGTIGGVIHATPLPIAELKALGLVKCTQTAQTAHVLRLSPTPAPDLAALGLDERRVHDIQSPGGPAWQRKNRPDTPAWATALTAIEEAMPAIQALRGPLDVFATTDYALGVVLGIRLENGSADAHYWQADGAKGSRRWVAVGQAEDSGLSGLQGDLSVQPGRAVALRVSITMEVQIRDVARSLDAAKVYEYQQVELRTHPIGHAVLSNPAMVRQVATDLKRALRELDRRSKRAPVHLFYAGPIAALMMAAGAFTTLGDITVYSYYKGGSPDGQDFYLPAICVRGDRVWLAAQ